LASREAKATFKITYKLTGDDGKPERWRYTFAQKPPKQLIRSDGPTKETLISDGKKTYYCKLGRPPVSCFVFASTSPLFSSEPALYPLFEADVFQLNAGIFDPASFVSTIKGWARVFAAGTAGYDVTFSKATFAGQPSECVSVLRLSKTGRSGGTKYCVATNGIVAYLGGLGAASGGSHSLASYSARVSNSDFSPPSGAKVTAVQATP
jgi:hypothetical protein